MLTNIKLGIMGSRSITDYKLLKQLINFIPYNISEIVSGGAGGVDKMARLYSLEKAIPLTEFIPRWNEEGKIAGPIRNQEMIRYCDYALILWDGSSPGTQSLITICQLEHVPYFLWDITFDHTYKIYGLGWPDVENAKYKQGWKTWVGMLKRVAEGKSTYSNVFIDPSWLLFSNFQRWYKKNKMFDWQLDKDLLSEGTHSHYGPDVCCYLPKEINQQLQRKQGWKKQGSGFVPSMIKKDLTIEGKPYCTEEEAKSEYVKMKLEYMKELVDNYSIWLTDEICKKLLEYKWI